MCKQGSQGISQTGVSQNWIFPILDKASSLPLGGILQVPQQL
ncbi:hypothetical protein [Prochlorococcus marinus]|uniref:Uncharacterized protein n=1 Tax=Prochlorococcus marinus str. PAC1 TaxID=59924 RepID=A0A0A2C3U4_PROMR|nr:hypothetical protein [Prochlorococcus marinus]KGG19334.1 hypothetical protein EV03_1716 [Prochlorococcus marinus str. PAC1]